MRVRERMDRLARQIAEADTAGSLRQAIAETLQIESVWSDGDDLDRLRLRAFDSLTRLTEEEQEPARNALLDDLLPLCLRTKEQWQNREVVAWYTDMLQKWLACFPEPGHFSTREALLIRLVEALDGPAAERACRLLGTIGYRDERASTRLLELARLGGDSVRDVALHALTALGMPAPLRQTLVQLWLERVSAVPWNRDLIGAAQKLASTDVLASVFDCWLTPGNLLESDASRGFLPHLAIAVPAAVAEASPDDVTLQDRVWERLRRLDSIAPELFFQRVLGSTQVAHPCDSPAVIRYYLSTLEADERTRDLAYFRLEECVRPRQLLGWDEDPGEKVIDHLLEDATRATAMVGSFMSQDLRRKVHGWQTLLSLGRAKVLARAQAAVEHEPNGHAVGAILELVACFEIAPVPPRVRDLLAGHFADMATDDSERVSSHIAAIAVARSSASSSALDALLEFNLIREGGVLISLIDALADTAEALLRGGDTLAVERLWEATTLGQPEHRRTAAAAALGKLLSHRVLQPLPSDRIAALLSDATLDQYARREVINGLGYFRRGDVPPKIVEILWRYLGESPGADLGNGAAEGGALRQISLVALARLGLLAEEPNTLVRYLGLRKEGPNWRCDRGMHLLGTPAVVGVLYVDNSDAFAPAAADILRQGNWTAVIQLAPFLREGPRPVPPPVIEALLERIQRAGPEVGEIDLIPLLADLNPARLTSESWSEMVDWPPQVRAAFADSLARDFAQVNQDHRINLLLALMGDGQYGVRRAAFRAMSRVSPEKLSSVCTAWALLTESNVQPLERPSAVDMRRRAAEGAAWLDSVPDQGPIADLASDPEPEVRATFARSQRERSERIWAAGYLRQVSGVRDNGSLLQAWRYGRALEQVGDDETLERLEERRHVSGLDPGIRHWLGLLIKKIRSRWDEVTRGWREPWFARRGRLEQVEALVGHDDADARRVSCWLWHVPPSDIVKFGVWGGWCPGVPFPTEIQTLRIPGRHAARILVTEVTVTGGAGATWFVGNDPYPEPAVGEDELVE